VETDSPRGRVALARKGLEKEIELGPRLFERMDACFDCLACNEICPVGIRPADLVLEMRGYQERLHPKYWKKAVFENLFSNPSLLEAATGPLRFYERFGVRRLVDMLGLWKLLPRRLRDMEAMLPPLPRRPLRRELPEVTEAQAGNRHRIGFFLGCLQSLMFSGESAAAVRVLARNGCTVVAPKETACCGMPALAFGRTEEARRQARNTIRIFEKAEVEYIVTDCATCGSSLKDYGRILADDPSWAERAAGFSSKIRDVSEFLLSLPLEKPRGRIEARVTYHDPCHLRRGQGIWREPRELIKKIDGVEFVELAEADWCCGLAGTQLITHYDTSLRVLKRKTDNLAAARAGLVASGCPACRMQLNVGIQRAGLDMQVTHPVVLLDRAYHGKRVVE
jgi:glycolate oxidase iron-sulfur subunit